MHDAQGGDATPAITDAGGVRPATAAADGAADTGAAEVGARRAQQLVLLFDGTSNNLTGSLNDTNVVKLAELLKTHPAPNRVVYYDPGVGHPAQLPAASVFDKARSRFDELQGLVSGGGVYENIAEGYLFLMRHWRPGDRIFIFGFSRGAFTARSVAGLVNQVGLLKPQMESLLPTLVHVYFADTAHTRRKPVAEQIKRLFVQDDATRVDLDFIGVWDTVDSVGMPPFRARFTALPDVKRKRFIHVRQALALDEHRLQFEPRLYAGDNGRFETCSQAQPEGSLQQRWFPGVHCDVGGGYGIQAEGLSNHALAWMVGEAVGCGLVLALPGQAALTADAAMAAARIAGAADPSLPVAKPCKPPTATLWAATGMCVRDTTAIELDNGQRLALQAAAAPEPAVPPAPGAAGSTWANAPAPASWWLGLLLLPLLWLAMGQMLFGPPGTGTLAGDWDHVLTHWCGYIRKAVEFQHWQLTGWIGPAWPGGDLPETACTGWLCTDWQAAATRFAYPLRALLLDLPFIVCYVLVLSWPAARSFARLAGLRRAGAGARPVLNRFGGALMLALLADLAEDAFTALAWLLAEASVVALPDALHLLAAGASLLKWLGLAATVLLVAAGFFRKLR